MFDMYWSSLAAELRTMILDALVQCGNVSHCACVSQEWKTAIGKHNFRPLRLTPADMSFMESLSSQSMDMVEYVYYCIELEEYGCVRWIVASPHRPKRHEVPASRVEEDFGPELARLDRTR